MYYIKFLSDDEIIIRDLFNNGVPPLDDTTMEAWKKQKMGQELDPAEREIINDHNKWLDEFISADKYVFINPMYNHFLPAELKQYLDVMAVAYKTFKYTSNLGDLYLCEMLRFFGIKKINKIFIEGVDAHRNKRDQIIITALNKAKNEALNF